MAVENVTQHRKALESLVPLAIAILLAIAALHFGRLKMIELGAAALGEQTAEVLGEEDGFRFTCSDATDSELCEKAYERAGHPPAIVWLGNSQNFAINRYKPGDKLAVMIVHRWLKDRKTWLVSYTQPNANLYEQAVVFEAAAQRYNPRLLILPVFMDKLREQGVRPAVAAFVRDPKTANALRTSPEWSELAPFLVQEDVRQTQTEKEPTIQARVEERFNAVLNEYLPIWSDRGNLRGNFEIALTHSSKPDARHSFVHEKTC